MQNHCTFTSDISIKHILVRLEVNFDPKHQLLYHYYHSNGFYLSSYVSNKPDNHLVVFHYHLSFIFFFFFFFGIPRIKVRRVT